MNCFESRISYPQFLKYLVPSVLTMIFLSFYTTIDGFFVSRYAGSDALAGINIVIPVTCVIFGTSVMLATGGGAIIGGVGGGGVTQMSAPSPQPQTISNRSKMDSNFFMEIVL